jgi:hypothetical protein
VPGIVETVIQARSELCVKLIRFSPSVWKPVNEEIAIETAV